MRNPYIIKNQRPRLKPSIFTFMDILGYSELIRQGANNTELFRLHNAMTIGRNWLEGAHIKNKHSGKDDYALKAFTDNIVIGWPIRSDGESEFGTAFFKLAYFQMQMVLDGYFIRGAISCGDVYVDEIAVFGPALIEAHDGEEKQARDPRIILTASAVQLVKQHLNYYPEKSWAPQNTHLLCDSDGQWFLNYLDVLLPAEEVALYEDLIKHKNVVEDALSKYASIPRVWSKYAWVARYHNYFCNKHSDFFDDTHMIKIQKFESLPKGILE